MIFFFLGKRKKPPKWISVTENFSCFFIQQVSYMAHQIWLMKNLCTMCPFNFLFCCWLWWYWINKITWLLGTLMNSLFFPNSMEGVTQLNDICLDSRVIWISFKRRELWKWALFKKDSVLTSLCLVFEYSWNYFLATMPYLAH